MNLFTKAKILLGLNKAWQETEEILNTPNPKPMKLKPGVKTTEFWITTALGIGAVVLGALDQVDGTYAAAAVTILGAVYTAARALVKAKDP